MTETKQQRYVKRHRDRVRANNARWARENADVNKAWTDANPERAAYNSQKARSKARGIDFLLSFEDWREWWGDDYDKRGRGKHDLCMCRIGDIGPYEIGNIYKATVQQNGKDIK